MKLVAGTFIAMVLLTVNANAQTQNLLDRKVVLPEKTLSLKLLLQEVSRQASITFSYGEIPLEKSINVPSREASVSELMKAIKAQTGFGYKLSGEKILLTRPVKKVSINGFIRDSETGENLIGANVFSLTESYGTLSNQFGFFSVTHASDT